jgi:type II secretory pathway pseudopilin PulG
MWRLRGFTYIGLLIAVALLSIGLAAVGQVWSTAMKRERERELLFIGAEFRRAIGHYYEASPGVKQYPRSLDDLLKDQRFPVTKRHLRKIYLDPMTGKPNWGLIVQGDQILGVHSQSMDQPLKTDNFAASDKAFAGTGTYSDWQFAYAPLEAPDAAVAPVAPGTQQSQNVKPPGAAPGQSAASPPVR